MTSILKSPTSSLGRRTAVWAAIAATVSLSLPQTLSAQPQRAAAPGVTVRLDRGQVQPFFDVLLSLDDAITAGRGKAPGDAPRRLDDLTAKSRPAKAAIRTFVADLRRAKQVEAFDTQVLAAAGRTGDSTLAADIRREGGPVAILGKADTLLDGLVAELRTASRPPGLDSLLEILGLSVTVEARRGTFCSFVMFVVSVGYGSEANYRTCMGNRR